jgi:DMSO/TMAO reductase YedYZ molybdopterin-dependent catalytic subunit
MAESEKPSRSPEEKVEALKRSAARQPAREAGERLPPGQVETKKWPVLHHGEIPRVDLAKWDFRVFGLIEKPLRLSWAEFDALPKSDTTSDIHCVTRWSRFGMRWRGVLVRDLMARVALRPEAAFVLAHGENGFTANLPLGDFMRDENLFATHADGAPLSPEHGGPLRLVVPHLYFWKSAKWLRGLEFLEKDRAGFWEGVGYHRRGDPWREERFEP